MDKTPFKGGLDRGPWLLVRVTPQNLDLARDDFIRRTSVC
jgi:hypothetical protein